jgi:SRSO17 transposase
MLMSTLLEQPEALALLQQTDVSADDVRACARRLTAFIQRYLPCFYRDEQRGHADTLLRGKLTSLQRKTTEPIATQAGQKRRPLQHFIGAGQWDDPTVRTELRRHVREELGDPQAVLILDNHGVPK